MTTTTPDPQDGDVSSDPALGDPEESTSWTSEGGATDDGPATDLPAPDAP